MCRTMYITERICHTSSGTYAAELISAVLMCHICSCSLTRMCHTFYTVNQTLSSSSSAEVTWPHLRQRYIFIIKIIIIINISSTKIKNIITNNNNNNNQKYIFESTKPGIYFPRYDYYCANAQVVTKVSG